MEKLKLTIEEYDPYIEEPNNLNWEKLGTYYDNKTGIMVYRLYIEMELDIEKLYQFRYESDDDSYLDIYKIISKLNTYEYLVAIYHDGYNRIFPTKRELVSWENGVEEIDVKKVFGIDLLQIQGCDAVGAKKISWCKSRCIRYHDCPNSEITG